MNTSASNRRIRVLLTAITKETLVPQPEFQRRLVWSNKDKVAFIKTVLEGYPFPEIYIAAGKVDANTGEGTELLVDGQQRITTLYQYFKNSDELKLPTTIKLYKDLTESEKIAFLEYEVVVRDLGNKSIDEIKEIFKRINSTSYGLNAMEIDNARFDGEFKKFAERIANLVFFERNKIFTANDIRRMKDTRFCLGLIVTIMSTYFTREKDIEYYLNNYNDIFPDQEKYESEIQETLKLIDSLNFPPKSRAFQKADFFTLFVEIHAALYKLDKKIDIPNSRASIESFYSRVNDAADGIISDDNAEQYYKAALQASNDRSSRILRGKMIQDCILETSGF